MEKHADSETKCFPAIGVFRVCFSGFNNFRISISRDLTDGFRYVFDLSYLPVCIYPTMSEVTAIEKILERLGFTREAAGYMTRACNVDSLDKVKWMDGEDDVGNMIKRVNCPGGTFTVGTGNEAVTTPNVGLQVYLRVENNLKLCVYFLKHMERVQRVPTAASITLEVVRGYREQ
jgi:hypothetical protein